MAMVLFNPYNSLWQRNAIISPVNKAEPVNRFAWSHTSNKQLSHDLQPAAVSTCAIQKTTQGHEHRALKSEEAKGSMLLTWSPSLTASRR